ncbi:hypothetical protein D3C75_1249620 [compost metagenome]
MDAGDGVDDGDVVDAGDGVDDDDGVIISPHAVTTSCVRIKKVAASARVALDSGLKLPLKSPVSKPACHSFITASSAQGAMSDMSFGFVAMLAPV